MSVFLLLVFTGLLTPSASLRAQQSLSTRRLLLRTAPAYPEIARSMALQGAVRVDALVSPDGSVKDVAIKGGHPVLAQAAANAVRHWKWEVSARESHEVVEVKFSPAAE
jgi:TonB family protein